MIDRQSRPGEAGFTLVEVLVAAMILLVGVLGVLTLLDAANASTHRTKVRDTATGLARELIEGTRAVPYPDLTPANIHAQLQAQPGLADAVAGGTWQVVRRNVSYTVSASVCSVDDGPADGYGDHSGGSFCADSTGTGTDDQNPDDYKRVSVTVTWRDGASTPVVRQEAVLNNPGSAFAPSVSAMTPNVSSPLTTNVGSIVFNPVKTTIAAQSVRWYVDNVDRGAASGSGTSWQFTWNVSGLVDGTYLVRGQAYDKYGQTGSGYVTTMVLNRNAPQTPTGVIGGRNRLWSNLVELEWTPNPERDITGYEVYRVAGTSPNLAADTLICHTDVSGANATSCADGSAPAGSQKYYVLALAPARSGSGVERSAPQSVLLDSDAPNLAPLAPALITATTLSGGGVRLNWTASVDPEARPIRYYRIYRDDSTATSGRIDRTASGTDLTWSDSGATASTHRYWVTAVDDHLAESPLSPIGGIQP